MARSDPRRHQASVESGTPSLQEDAAGTGRGASDRGRPALDPALARAPDPTPSLRQAELPSVAWPVELAPQEDGTILVSFPDIPEALTEGETESDAMAQAQDCLVAALGGYVAARCAIPRPTPAHGRPMITLPALAAAKVALYVTMLAKKISNTALAAQLGLSEGAVWRLIDLDHRSHIGQIEKALRVLGQRLTVSTLAA